MSDNGLQSKCQTVWFEKNKNSLNLEFKPYNISCMVETRRDSIQASKIHSELMFRYYSYYNDTRGVTTSPRLTLPPFWNRTIVSPFLTMKMERGEDVPHPESLLG
jgi:uncharacterized protein YcfL